MIWLRRYVWFDQLYSAAIHDNGQASAGGDRDADGPPAV